MQNMHKIIKVEKAIICNTCRPCRLVLVNGHISKFTEFIAIKAKRSAALSSIKVDYMTNN